MIEPRQISPSKQSVKLRLSIAGLCLVLTAATPALAFRPFDGTDAAVADTGKMEVELQPAGRLHDDSGTTLIAPATRFNFGLTEGWEGVLEGLVQTPLSPSGPSSLTAAGAFLKGVVRPGSLQDKAGPSVATEFGVLLPDSIGETGFGASAAWIVSQRWDWGAIHLNAATTLTREHRGDIFLGTIVEGPGKWTVRPVAEVFYEKEFGQGIPDAKWRAAVEKTGGRYYVAKNEATLIAAVDDINREAAGAISARQYSSQQPRFTLFALAAFAFWTGAAGLKVGTPWFGRIP